MGRNGLHLSTTPTLFVLAATSALCDWLELWGTKVTVHQRKRFCILIHGAVNWRLSLNWK